MVAVWEQSNYCVIDRSRQRSLFLRPSTGGPSMTALPKERSESAFADYKEAFTTVQAVAEANRCLYCADAPCIQACPTGIEIPEFIRKISTGNVKGSARTI